MYEVIGQLQNEFGVEFYSSFEYKFLAMKVGQLLGNAGHSCSSVILKNTEELCYEVCLIVQFFIFTNNSSSPTPYFEFSIAEDF